MLVGRRRRRFRVKVATDGEIAYLLTPLVFRPSPHALQLIVPKPAIDTADVDQPAAPDTQLPAENGPRRDAAAA